MLKEFKEFIARGNVIDLAVAVVIGAAFGKIVTSFVEDIVMPPVGLLLGHVDFSNLFVDLSGTGYATLEAAKEAGAPVLRYGMFLNAIVSFLIIAFAVFLMVRMVNKLKKEAPAADPTTKDCPRCFTSIPIKATRCPSCTSELGTA
jgi:large conductance mechanosensitive channel